MKIVLAVTKPQLADVLSSSIPKEEDITYAYTEFELNKTLTRMGNDIDFIFIHEDIFADKYPWDWMSSIKNTIPAKTKMVVILSDNTDSLYKEIIKRISIDLSISLIPNGLTALELSEDINSRLYNNVKPKEGIEAGRVVTLLSASPKDGATTIAISTAICMAMRMPDRKVLLVDFNLKSPEIRDHLHVSSDKGYPLIQADCDSGTLEASTLMKACSHLKGIDNLYILTGIQRREWAEKITMEEVDHLLLIARKAFDVTIVDVHTYPDQAATLKSVKSADERLVVVQPIITSYQSSWNDWFNSVWQHYGLKESDFHLVLNRSTKATLEGFQIEKAMGTKIISRIRNVDKGAGIKAINYGQPMYLSTEENSFEFRTNILELTSWLAERAKHEITPLQNDKKSALNKKTWVNSLISIFK